MRKGLLIEKRKYQRISKILKDSPVKGSQSWLTREQAEKLKSAAEISLALIATAGIFGISLIAPNLLTVLDKAIFKQKKYSKKEKIQKTVQIFRYLRKHGYIQFKDERKDRFIFITKRGKERLNKIFCNNIKIEKTNKWNGRWWLVASDIPVKEYREAADMFRRKLRNMGLLNLQKSLWFYPFDPRKEIEFIAKHYGISQYVTVMEIYRLDIEDEETLKKHFQKNGIF